MQRDMAFVLSNTTLRICQTQQSRQTATSLSLKKQCCGHSITLFEYQRYHVFRRPSFHKQSHCTMVVSRSSGKETSQQNVLEQYFPAMSQRPRRNRRTSAIRSLTRESILLPQHLVYPIFIHESNQVKTISAMPDCQVHSLDSLLEQVRIVSELGVQNIILFPKIDDRLKSNHASECYNPSGLVPTAIRAIKERFPNVMVWTDIALDPYSSLGHDGIVGDDHRGDNGQATVLNDETVRQLCRQALCHADAGADIVAPSDMMDGRTGAIRRVLDANGYEHVSICSYTAKYASSFYGPFREALDSAPVSQKGVPKDKKTYQMDPGNSREAIREAALDEEEGADMLMVKPGLPYLDIVRLIRQNSRLPLVVYQVSGEYSMIKAACQNGWLDEKQCVLETLLCFRRAGADAILTYFAKQAAMWLAQ